MKYTYTLIVKWKNGNCEEVDVVATSARSAILACKKDLRKNYNPGWRIVRVMRRVGTLFL